MKLNKPLTQAIVHKYYATPDLTEKLNFLALTNTKKIRTLSDTMCILIGPKKFVRSITKVFMAIYSKKVFEL